MSERLRHERRHPDRQTKKNRFFLLGDDPPPTSYNPFMDRDFLRARDSVRRKTATFKRPVFLRGYSNEYIVRVKTADLNFS
jgi:hypothetical protein